MEKIILKKQLSNEIIEIEGKVISLPKGWEIIKSEKEKNNSSKKNANGDGSFYFSETLQKWVGQIQPPNGGKRITITQRKNETKTECKNRYNDIKSKINSGTYIEKSRDTLYEIIERHIEQKLKDGITCPSSYIRDTNTLKEIEKTCKNFINKPIQKVVIEDIEDAKDFMREYSSEVIDKMWGMLKVGFKIAMSRRKITFNIMEDITLKKPISLKKKTIRHALTIKEENKLRDILNNEEKDHKYRDIVVMQLNTGMRIGEVLSREIDDFNFEENTTHIWNTITRNTYNNFIIGEHTKIYDKKTQIDKGERTIPMDNETRNIALQIIQSPLRNIHNLLFWNYEENRLIKYSEVNSWLRRLNEKYKITKNSLSTHILRHTRITRMREIGVLLPVIQYTVGQVEGSEVTDEVYTSVSLDFVNNELKKANMI